MPGCAVDLMLNSGGHTGGYQAQELDRYVSHPTSMYVTTKAIRKGTTSNMPRLRSRKVGPAHGFEAVSVLQALLGELSV